LLGWHSDEHWSELTMHMLDYRNFINSAEKIQKKLLEISS